MCVKRITYLFLRFHFLEFAILACALSVVEFPFAVKTNMSRLRSRVLFSKLLLVDIFMDMMIEVSDVVVVTVPKVA